MMLSITIKKGKCDTQHNNIQRSNKNETQHGNKKYDTQHDDTRLITKIFNFQHNDTQHNKSVT
jgi:hypothetical protein